MQSISLDDPAWQMTFPHRVTPRPDEWLLGLLLRCDETNHWGSRTTLTHLLSPGPEKFHRCWRTENPYLVLIQPSSLDLDYLAQRLLIPTSTLLATTYHTELLRLCDAARPHPRLLGASFTFHLCPACLAEARLLRRTLTLPHITICPEHQITRLSQCQCGASLQLFHQQSRPFICHTCGLHWADLPWIKAVPSQLALEQKLLAWYEFFFSQGTPPMMRTAMQLVDYLPLNTTLKRLPLGTLVILLVQCGRSPQDMLSWMDRASRRGAKWTKPEGEDGNSL